MSSEVKVNMISIMLMDLMVPFGPANWNSPGESLAMLQGCESLPDERGCRNPQIEGHCPSAILHLRRHILGEAFVDQVANVQCPETWES